MKRKKIKNLYIAALCFLMVLSLGFFAFSSEDSFEASLDGFPESYRVHLRELHERYPEWVFVPMNTGLDWKTVIKNESGNKSLVAAGDVASSIFKSRKSGDYNKATGTYIQKDSGFVTANEIAVSYFMDPRNFLTESNIFQFESLAFDESYTVDAVEFVLKGSFMSEKKIEYFDSEGEKQFLEITYGEAILEAGRKNNINPCFIASKILGEVGTKGSASSSGQHSDYPGIYNFYNIGATDGVGAIGRGLSWASSGSTYERPWTDPQKSISGGAKYLAEKYTEKGQFTGYLQKFNVNPNGYYGLYQHQYMTNITGALSQGYTSYVSYVKSGLLQNRHVFSIPVFENMFEAEGEKVGLYDGINQKGTINQSASFVRTGPSTYNAKLCDASGNAVKLSKGTVVNVIEKMETDYDYYLSVLSYPYWYKVNFTYSGKTYEGFVPAGFVDITSQTVVKTLDKYSPSLYKTSSQGKLSYLSLDEDIIKVNDDSSLTFLKAGSCTVVGYDSLGKLEKVVYKIQKAPTLLSPLSQKASFSGTSSKISFEKGSDDDTELSLFEASSGYQRMVLTSNKTYTFKNLDSSKGYTVSLRGARGNYYSPCVILSFVSPPKIVEGGDFFFDDTGRTVLTWKKQTCTGYVVYYYDGEKYYKIKTTKSNVFTVPEEFSQYLSFSVRAYVNFEGKNFYGPYSEIINVDNPLPPPENPKLKKVTATALSLSWDKVEDAVGYNIYSFENDKYIKVGTSKVNSVTLSNLSKDKLYSLCISTIYNSLDKTQKDGRKSEAFKISLKPSKPASFKAAANQKETTFTWKENPIASYYRIYSYNKTTKKYKLKSQLPSSGCYFSDLPFGEKVTFALKTFVETDFGTLYSDLSEISFYTQPKAVQKLTLSKNEAASQTLSWAKAPGATHYRIYVYDPKTKTYKKLVTTTKLSFKVTSLKKGTTYTYKIKSLTASSGKTVSSAPASSAFKFTTKK